MLFDWQRGHVTPLGHRSSTSRSRHCSSLPNCSISFGRFMSHLKDLIGFLFIIMPRLNKPAHKMTDKELLHSVFPKKVVKEIKKIARKHRKPRKTISITRPT